MKKNLIMILLILLIPIFAQAESVQTGKFKYMPAFEEETEEVYYYSDDYFRQSSKVSNEHLTGMSFNLALSTFEIKGSSYSKTLLEEIGFTSIQIEDMNEKPTMDTIGTVIGYKKIDNSTLIAVAIRGEKYDSEWGNNFIAGTEGNAEGFDSASIKVITRIKDYINNNNLSNIKIWIVGYSRAGAISNLTGVYINNHLGEFNTTEDDLYVYTFEAPKAVNSSITYNNIYNIKNINDIIPMVYPEEWDLHTNGNEISIGESQTITIYTGLEEITEYGEIELNEFYQQFFSWLTSRLSRELYSEQLEAPVSKLFDIYFSKSDADREKFLNFFMEDVKGELLDNQENFKNIKGKLWSILSHNSDYLYEDITKDIITIINSVRTSSNGSSITDEEFQTIINSIQPLLRIIGPIIIDDTNYYDGIDYDEFYHTQAVDYNLTDAEMGEKYGKIDGEYMGYYDGLLGNPKDENSYATSSEYGPSYDEAYKNAYVTAYLENYDFGEYHKNNIVEKAKYDADQKAYSYGYDDGINSFEKRTYDVDFYIEDWMTEEYIEAYNEFFKEGYLKGYEEGLKNPATEEEEEYPESLSLYHFASLIKNISAITKNHYPQENLKLIHEYDSYYAPYNLIEGANQTIDNSDDQEDILTFKTSGHLEKLVKVQVDDEDLTGDDYESMSGSTIITLKNSYLKTLEDGTHTLKLIYIDNIIETTFTVENNGLEILPPDTGVAKDNNEMTIVFYVFSIVGLSGLFHFKKEY